MRAVWELLFPSRVAVVCATEVNATLLYGKFDIEGLFVEIRLPFSPIVPLIKQCQQKRQFWWLFSYYGHLATKSWAEITKSQAALEMSVYACRSHSDVIQKSIWICTLVGGQGAGRRQKQFLGCVVRTICCLCVLLFSNTTPLVPKPTTFLYPWNNPGLGMLFLHFHVNRLPATSEVLCDKNKGNITCYRVDSFINCSPVKTSFADTHSYVNHRSVMARPSLRLFSFGRRGSIRL